MTNFVPGLARKSGDIEYDYIFKVVLLGDMGVGKTSLTLRLLEDHFYTSLSATIAVDFRMWTTTVDQKSVKLQIWDAAGQERFRSLLPSFYRGANGVFLCFDLTQSPGPDGLTAPSGNIARSQARTFELVKDYWVKEIRRHCCPSQICVLVGTKSDLSSIRQVSEADAQGFAKAEGFAYLETSAKDNTNVQEAFSAIAKAILVVEQGKLQAQFAEQQARQNEAKTQTRSSSTFTKPWGARSAARACDAHGSTVTFDGQSCQ
eukprot:gene2290-3144_t